MERPVILAIMDGWGNAPDSEGNAITRASTPVIDRLTREYPATQLEASGDSVGLPEGQMGNSEVGHLNIGAGRIVYQDFTRISRAIRSGEFIANPVFCKAVDGAKERGASLHFMGLLSDGGVHSHIDHLFSLVGLAKERGLSRFYIHAFMDGRDTSPRSGAGYIDALEACLKESGAGSVATVMGRFYAMDRDNRWNRIKEAYLAMTGGGGRRASSAAEAMNISYSEDKGDEFMTPTVIDEDGIIREGDSIIFFNFRADRAREITKAFTQEDFSGFRDVNRPALSSFICMTRYDATLDLPVAFPPVPLDNFLGRIVSSSGMKQLRIAETEKYAHVTFFFNGGEESYFPGEERVLIPSPKEVRTYDKKPEMSAPEVTTEVIRRMREVKYNLIILNYANCDMVGHTGSLDAAVMAVETVDSCIGRIIETAKNTGYRVLITSDHGNAEQMVNPKTGQPHTAHTLNPVPFIIADDELKGRSLRPGILADVAPTILELLGMDKPASMDGISLLMPAR